jgi:hypothetical protein
MAAPFEPATIPDTALAVGHVDVDLARKTNMYAAMEASGALAPRFDGLPPNLKALAPAALDAVRGISFWRGPEHGALYIETGDARLVAQLIAQMTMILTPGRAVDGAPTWAFKGHRSMDGWLATVGPTVVLANSADSLEQSIRALDGHGANLAGARKLTASTRSGILMFVTIGNDLIDQIQGSTQSKIMQLPMKSMQLDMTETGTILLGNLHAEMANAEAAAKAKSILDGLVAFASLSDDDDVKALVSDVVVTTSGLDVDVVAKLSEARLVKMTGSRDRRALIHERFRAHLGHPDH